MYSISIQFTSINAEKIASNMPPKIDFNINLTLPSGEPVRRDNQYIIPFTFTISSIPPLVQIILRGQAIVLSNNVKELKKLEEDIKKKKIPGSIVQAIFTNSIAESILISRSLGVPPPLPGLPQLQQMKPGMSREKKGFGQESVI